MTTDPGVAGYFAADAEAGDELARVRLIEDAFDAHTFRHLEAIGVGSGWRCLEVGAGAGSVVRWLSGRVGETGKVVAADIDPRFLGDLHEANIEVRRCDITCDEIEPSHYDLVHSRLLLVHLDEPAEVLHRMAVGLRPGGWLIAEECDGTVVRAVDATHPLAAVFDSCNRKGWEFTTETGILDAYYGRALPAQMRALGLVEMGNDALSWVARGGEDWSRWWIQTWQRVRDVMIAEGVLSEAEMADLRRALEDPTFSYRAYLLQTVWGRKPVKP